MPRHLGVETFRIKWELCFQKVPVTLQLVKLWGGKTEGPLSNNFWSGAAT